MTTIMVTTMIALLLLGFPMMIPLITAAIIATLNISPSVTLLTLNCLRSVTTSDMAYSAAASIAACVGGSLGHTTSDTRLYVCGTSLRD